MNLNYDCKVLATKRLLVVAAVSSQPLKPAREADEAELFELGRQRLNALAKEGVTTVEIKSGYGLDIETELKLLRVARELGKHHHVDVKTPF